VPSSTNGKEGVAGSIPAGGSTHRLTSGNAGYSASGVLVEQATLAGLAFEVVLEDASRIESTSLVNRSGSGRAGLKTLSACGTRGCEEGRVLPAHCSASRQTTWSGAKEGQNGKHPAVLVGRLG
jgi:hypothetical protein